MIITLKNSLGVYKPLDIFDDFEVNYNHQYEDYTEVGAKRIPYTNKFKIPTTTNNRNLCGLPFDLTYPLAYSVEGRMLYADGSLAFEFIADIEGQRTNVLQPYIEISIIDKISKALLDLSQYKMSDLMEGIYVNLKNDAWVFGNQDLLDEINKVFVFPYYNFNNRNSVVAFDSKRGINQLQPTFILNKLVNKMFDYIGLNVESKFLNNDGELSYGIKANQLGLMLPIDLMTTDDYEFSVPYNFSFKIEENNYNSQPDGHGIFFYRGDGLPVQVPTSTRLNLNNFVNQSANNQPLKMNYDWRSDYYTADVLSLGNYSPEYCSTVNGELTIKSSSLPITGDKPAVYLGTCYIDDGVVDDTQTVVSTFVVDSMITTNPKDLAIRLVNSDMEKMIGFKRVDINNNGINYYYESGNNYNINDYEIVGIARYVGEDLPNKRGWKYEIELYDNIETTMTVEANQDLGLSYALCPLEGEDEYVLDYIAKDYFHDVYYTIKMTIKDGYITHDVISVNAVSGTAYTSDEIDLAAVYFSYTDEMFGSLSFSFKEATTIPSGFSAGNNLNGRTDNDIVNCSIDMSESFTTVNDYLLLDILKMIMERFNLLLYTDSSGVIHLDTDANRKSGVLIPIDHLLDEGIDVNYTKGEYGILTVTDTNPSFYDDDFNRLSKYIVSEERRNEKTQSFKSCIVNDKMFEDTYSDIAYDVLKQVNDSDYWGISDRVQETPSALKPTFCLLENHNVQVYFPFNDCSDSYYDYDSDEEQFDVGFYNRFNPRKTMKLKAVNIASDGFKLISFEDDENIYGIDNLYKKIWYDEVLDKMSDESVIAEFELYISENNFKILKDFPTILYRGQKWNFKGFNDYPLSSNYGGVTSIRLTKDKDTSSIINKASNLVAVESLTGTVKVVNLTWDIDNTDSDIYSVIIERRKDSGSWELFSQLSDVSIISDTDSFVLSGSAYEYRIKAYTNEFGGLASYNESNSVTISTATNTTPLKVRNVIATQYNSDFRIDITWFESESIDGIANYLIYGRKGNETPVLIATVDSNTTSYTDESSFLTCCEDYSYIIVAKANSDLVSESSESNIVELEYNYPDNITNFTANVSYVFNPARIRLTWNEATPLGDNYLYYIQKRVNEGVWTDILLAEDNDQTYIDADLVSGNDYQYRIKAMNERLVLSAEYSYSSIISYT